MPDSGKWQCLTSCVYATPQYFESVKNSGRLVASLPDSRLHLLDQPGPHKRLRSVSLCSAVTVSGVFHLLRL